MTADPLARFAEEEAGHAAATNKGALIYGSASTAAWFGLHSIAMRTSTFYRQRLPPSLKAAGCVPPSTRARAAAVLPGKPTADS
jgi:hypothetical protein